VFVYHKYDNTVKPGCIKVDRFKTYKLFAHSGVQHFVIYYVSLRF